MFDLVIKGGLVVKGDQSSPRLADVGIKDGLIETVDDAIPPESAKEVLDATGMVVSPGFVDIHSHCDIYPLQSPDAAAMTMQGITTALGGNCGLSVAPCPTHHRDAWQKMYESIWGTSDVSWEWGTMAQFYDCADELGSAINLAMLAGYGPIRLGLAGASPAPCDRDQVYEACRKALDEGAYGISIGLHYFPCCYAHEAELTAIGKALAQNGGILGVHMRSYGDDLEASVRENLAIAERTGCSLQISHLHAAGRQNWDRLRYAIEEIEEARERGVNVHFDRHPYAAGSSTILTLLPPWAQEGGMDEIRARLTDERTKDRIRKVFETGLPGWDCFAILAGWDRIVINDIEDSRGQRFVGKSVAEISEAEAMDPTDVLAHLIIEFGTTTPVVLHHMEEEGIFDVIAHPLGMVGSDSLYSPRPHPRTYGTYARWIGEYVRKRKRLSLEEAVYKATWYPCQKMGIRDRGLIRRGYHADIVVFNLDEIDELSTFSDPWRHPAGIRDVLVNGTAVVRNAQPTGNRPGAILRR